MTHDPETLLAHYSAIEWLWLNGITNEIGEVAGAAWARTAVAPSNDTPKEQASIVSITVPAADNALVALTTLEAFNSYVRDWKEMGLAKTAFSTVVGIGPLEPRLLVVSDMPDDHEDRSGASFGSPFNMLVRKAISHAGFSDDHVYYTYLSKWRTPSRRTLTTTETAFCANLLNKEIELVAPMAILALGESVTRVLLPDLGLGLLRFPVVKTYKNQQHGPALPLLASQKGEFLVKNSLMKKSFWFGLIEFAEAMRSGIPARNATGANNAEYISDV